MGSSGYLAAKSEQEVYAHEIAMERDEIALMPEVERDELALIYEAKGMDAESAHALATRGDGRPAADAGGAGAGGARHRRAAHVAAARGWVTGLATAFGALIPVFPFFFLDGRAAIVLSFIARDGVALPRRRGALGVHRARRVPLGLDMFVVGLGVARVGYFVGELLEGRL